MLASAMSSSRIGPCPHHSERRWPSTRRSSPSRSRYSKTSSLPAVNVVSVINQRAGSRRSKALDSARNLVELRMPVNLVRARLEERPCLVTRRCSDGNRRHDPETYYRAASGVDVAGVLQCQLRVGRVKTAYVLVWRPLTFLREDLPQRPLRFPVVGVRHGCRATRPSTPARVDALPRKPPRPRAPRLRSRARRAVPEVARDCTGHCPLRRPRIRPSRWARNPSAASLRCT